jgi:hypothetical protein
MQRFLVLGTSSLGTFRMRARIVDIPDSMDWALTRLGRSDRGYSSSRGS